MIEISNLEQNLHELELDLANNYIDNIGFERVFNNSAGKLKLNVDLNNIVNIDLYNDGNVDITYDGVG